MAKAKAAAKAKGAKQAVKKASGLGARGSGRSKVAPKTSAKHVAKPAKPAKPAKAAARPTKAAPKPAGKIAAKPVAARPTKAPAKPVEAVVDEAGLGWIPAGDGYQVSLDDGKLVARSISASGKGKRLTSVPKQVRASDVADQLEALGDWLDEHERDCAATIDQWMLRSLPVPRAVLEQVWDDPAWRKPLENAVVIAVGADGSLDHAAIGLFRGVDRKHGVGVVDLDGETRWLDADRLAIPHPILMAELDGWRELVTQLGITQGIAQLHRETYAKPTGEAAGGTSIEQFSDGKFAMLMHAIGKAKGLGYKVRGGFAVCKAWDGETTSEARFWIGADAPDAETLTGSLQWVDDRERGLAVAVVGRVAFSEGMRMASSIYAARVVEKEAEAES